MLIMFCDYLEPRIHQHRTKKSYMYIMDTCTEQTTVNRLLMIE